jgi:FeS assembly SUF system protein
MNEQQSNQTITTTTSSDNGTEQNVISSVEKTVIEAQVIETLQSCFDPEIPVNIYELGLIYGVHVSDTGFVTVKMTLTTPHCPAAQSLPSEVDAKLRKVKGVTGVKVDVVWEPQWNPSMMSEAAKLELGFY